MLKGPKGNEDMQDKREMEICKEQREMEICKRKGKWRYASSTQGNGDMQAAKRQMEICKQQSRNGNMQAAKRIEMRHLP